MDDFDPAAVALLLVDMQNDFLHPDGAYGRAGVGAPEIAALPERLAPVAAACREAGMWIISTHFTLLPDRSGAPMISPHLQRVRPFLARGDFQSGTFGHALIDSLQPAHAGIEKVAFSAFYMSRMDFVLQRAGIKTLVFAGIVTNGGVASTLRDAHVRDYHTVLLTDGCAAFDPTLHDNTCAALASISTVMTCTDFLADLA